MFNAMKIIFAFLLISCFCAPSGLATAGTGWWLTTSKPVDTSIRRTVSDHQDPGVGAGSKSNSRISGGNRSTSQPRPQDKRSGAFSNPQDNPELPNVLLIGDSISIGYTQQVRQRLAGKADVYRIPTNARYSGYGLKNLDKWLAMTPGKWDVIHFNWGLWDLCYRNPKSKTQGNRDKVNGKLTATTDEYRANLEKIVKRLKKTGAKLIWCTTTPIPENEAGRKLGDEIRYNAVAAEIMKANGVLINDLHAHAKQKTPGIFVAKGNVHFTQDGYSYLAAKVAQEISAVLPPQSGKK